MSAQSPREEELARIAALEARQDGRRARIKEIEDVIDRKQLEIDNRRAQLNKPPAPAAAPPRGLSALP